MAEGLFRQLLEEKKNETIGCGSAGLSALEGEPPAQNAVAACREAGVEIGSHRAHRLSPEDIPVWDVYFTMSKTHAYILEQAGVDRDKIYVADYVEDPYGGDLEVYRKCRDKLRQELAAFYGELTRHLTP